MKKKILQDRLGLIDWGIGGLSVYKEIKRQFPKTDIVYFSDSGFTPYGKAKKTPLVKRLSQISEFFRQQDIKTIVIACNAASTVLEDVQRINPDIQYFGMLSAGTQALRECKKKSLLVLGGKRTIDCGYFQNEFKKNRIELQALVAQPLSALIERGLQNSKKFSAEVDQLARQAFANKTAHPVQAVLLACTHYPAATKIFARKFKNAQILDPARQVVAELSKKVSLRQKKQKTAFFTTGSPQQSRTAAKKAFGLRSALFRKVVWP